MQGKRIERIAALIKEELARALTQKARDPRIGFVTVTQVEVSEDLKFAKVFYSVLGTDEQKQKTAEGLEKARGFLQKDIAQNLNIRFTPHLNFILDPSLDEGMKIDAIIQKIHEQEKPSAG
jgi:ribosome-binding factor A